MKSKAKKSMKKMAQKKRAIKAKAYHEDRPYTDIVREAVRTLLTLPEVEG